MEDKSQHIMMCSTFARDVFDALDIADEIETNELTRQVAATFIFGVINAYAHENKLEPPQLHAITISLLSSKFDYSGQQSIDFAQMLIEATKKENDPTRNAIIHHGINSTGINKEN